MNNSPSEIRKIIRDFTNRPQEENKAFFDIMENLRAFLILWDMESIEQLQKYDIVQKQQLLLAYKYLHLIWFELLPEDVSEEFLVYVAENIHDNITFESAKEAFEQAFPKDLAVPPPAWLEQLNFSKKVKLSIDAFPAHRVLVRR